jgi:hypothetical protein
MLLIISLSTSCNKKKQTGNRLDSSNIRTKAERIEILKNEIKSFSEINDAEFDLFNVNGFHDADVMVPGASSWDYKFAIKVDTADISKWRVGMKKIQPAEFDDRWMRELVEKRSEDWQTTSDPVYYERPNDDVIMIEYYKDGIIFKRVRTYD